MPEPVAKLSPRLVTTVIMLALVVWGVYLAVGSYLHNHNPWRAVVVLVCVGGYLAFWLLMLRSQRSTKRD